MVWIIRPMGKLKIKTATQQPKKKRQTSQLSKVRHGQLLRGRKRKRKFKKSKYTRPGERGE